MLKIREMAEGGGSFFLGRLSFGVTAEIMKLLAEISGGTNLPIPPWLSITLILNLLLFLFTIFRLSYHL